MGENLTTGSLFYAAGNDNTWVKLGDVADATLASNDITTSTITINTGTPAVANTVSATPDATPIYNCVEVMKKGAKKWF